MTEYEINRKLFNAKKSMEIEGFIIDDALVEQGRKILTGELSVDEVVARYVRKAKEYGSKYE